MGGKVRLEEFALLNAEKILGVQLFRKRKDFFGHLKTFVQDAQDNDGAEYFLEELRECAGGFVPDSWAFIPYPGEKGLHRGKIILIEIEDSNKLSERKLHAISQFWWAVDAESMFLECHCFDRYGKSCVVLSDEDLCGYSYNVLFKTRENIKT